MPGSETKKARDRERMKRIRASTVVIVGDQARVISVLSEALLKLVDTYEGEYDTGIPIERPKWLEDAIRIAEPIDWAKAREELED